MSRFLRTLLSITFCGVALSACGGRDFADLDAFMAEKRARPGGIIAPIPTFKAYEAFAYSATTLRSPFDRPIEVREIAQLQSVAAIKPDEDRERTATDERCRSVAQLRRSSVTRQITS